MCAVCVCVSVRMNNFRYFFGWEFRNPHKISSFFFPFSKNFANMWIYLSRVINHLLDKIELFILAFIFIILFRTKKRVFYVESSHCNRMHEKFNAQHFL